MRQEQWEKFKRAAKGQRTGGVPLALIFDSPWIPGYLGISHLDYYLDPEVWFQANLRVIEDFPEAIVFPSWWIEYGMAIEPSALGAKIVFHQDQTPSVSRMLFRAEDAELLSPIDPFTDGFMALALRRYQVQKQRIFDAGYTIPLAAARGPMCTAAFVRGVTEFMLDIVDAPEAAHKLLDVATEGIIRWLKAQAEVIGDSVEGIFVLDDIVGFLSRKNYIEFAHPYLRRICDAFPANWVKVYHNDAKISPFVEDLAETGFDVLNWGHSLDVAQVGKRTGGKLRLMGNVSPLEIGVRGTPQQVRVAALDVLSKANGAGIILSMGGGVSPGMPKDNVQAMIDAVQEFNCCR
jgi:uroporphyrinogen-III decarboxylase